METGDISIKVGERCVSISLSLFLYPYKVPTEIILFYNLMYQTIKCLPFLCLLMILKFIYKYYVDHYSRVFSDDFDFVFLIICLLIQPQRLKKIQNLNPNRYLRDCTVRFFNIEKVKWMYKLQS